MENKSIKDSWKIDPESQEYINLSSGLREKIDRYRSMIPVDVDAIAEELNVKIDYCDLRRGISGEIAYEESGDFLIRINQNEDKHRQRFTLAHQLAHYLLHREMIIANGDLSENFLLRSKLPKHVEYAANRLASDIVMPSEKLKEAIQEYPEPINSRDIDEVADRFKVAATMMRIRLNMAHILSNLDSNPSSANLVEPV